MWGNVLGLLSLQAGIYGQRCGITCIIEAGWFILGFWNDVCLSLKRPAQSQTEYMKDDIVTTILEQSPLNGTCSNYVPANT